MTEKCKKCGIELDDETPQQNGMCIDCFADDLAELVELSPMVGPQVLLKEGKIEPVDEDGPIVHK